MWPLVFSKMGWNWGPCRRLQGDVHNIFICGYQSEETAKMPFKSEIFVQPLKGVSFHSNNKNKWMNKNEPPGHEEIEKCFEKVFLEKQVKLAKLHNAWFPTTQHSGKGKAMDMVVLGRGGWDTQRGAEADVGVRVGKILLGHMCRVPCRVSWWKDMAAAWNPRHLSMLGPV